MTADALLARQQVLGPARPEHRSFRLTRAASSSLTSELLPPIVLGDPVARRLLEVAGGADVCADGCYSAGADGIQVWSAPWNGRGSRPGTAVHLGSVAWTWHPHEGTLRLHRVSVTAAGLATGSSVRSVLLSVLDLPEQPGSTFAPQQREPLRTATTSRR